jgi:hypothetical protein
LGPAESRDAGMFPSRACSSTSQPLGRFDPARLSFVRGRARTFVRTQLLLLVAQEPASAGRSVCHGIKAGAPLHCNGAGGGSCRRELV